MKKRIVICAALVFLLMGGVRGISQAQETSAYDYSPALHVIDTWLEAMRDYDRLPGISVSFVSDQDILFSRGYGLADVEKEIPAGPDTIYSICSISKLFTSIAIMRNRDAGRLRLEDRIADLLPWFNLEQRFKDSGPITVRSVLTHSSGLPREADYPYWTGPEFPFPTREQIKARLGGQKTLYPASTYFQYSNLGLTLLGEVVSEVSGVPYDRYIRDHILKPLQMADTRTVLPESLWGGKLATGYSALKRDGSRDVVPFFQAEGIKPAAGFSSTAEDLARFAAWQLRLLENGGEEILKASTLREMHRVHWVDPDWKTAWGLGFSVSEVDGRSMVGHGGSCPGYRTSIKIDSRKKKAFVAMINAQGVSPDKYINGMRAVLKKAEEGKPERSAPGTDLEVYAGTYTAQPWSGESVVLSWYGKLAVLGLPSSNPASGLTLYRHIEEDVFRRIRKDETLGEELVFERDESGRVHRMWRNSNYSTKMK